MPASLTDAVVITGELAEIDVGRCIRLMSEAGEFDPAMPYEEFMQRMIELIRNQAPEIHSFRFTGATVLRGDTLGGASSGSSTVGPDVVIG